MNFLLKMFGLEEGADVHRIVDGFWHQSQSLPTAALVVLLVVGLALAVINFLPWISMRPSVRVGTFVLRLAMLGVLLLAVYRLEWHVDLELNERQRWTVLVDDSASMSTNDVDGKSRFEAAQAELARIQDSVAGQVDLDIATFSGAALGDKPSEGPTLVRDAVGRTALSRSQTNRLVVLSDGRDSEGRDLTRLGEDLKARDIHLSVVLYGSAVAPSDAGIQADAERTTIRLGEELLVRGAVTGTGAREERTVSLKEDGKQIKTFPVLPAASGRFEVRHRPKNKGQHTISLELASQDTVAQNNKTSFTINVVEERINVLLIEGFPRFEFKLIKSILEVDPLIKLVSVCHIPGGGVYVQGQPLHRNPEQGLISSQADLFKYDVVILQDLSRSYYRADGDTTESRLRSVVEFVTKRGGGLVVLGGQDVYRAGGFEDSALVDVLPFDLTNQISGEPQFDGMFFANVSKPALDHPVLRLLPDAAENQERLGALPQLDGSNNVGRFKPLATPLLTRTVKVKGKGDTQVEKETPIMGYMAIGEGKVLAAAVDTFWRWQLQPDYDDPPLTMMLANAIRYLAPPPGRKPDAPNVAIGDGTPQVGQELKLSTELKDKNFDPIRNAELDVTVTRPDGGSYHIYPRDLPEEPGFYAYSVLLEQPGPYKVVSKFGKLEATRELLAGTATGEFADLSVDRKGVERLAKAAGGEVVDPGAVDWQASVNMQPARRRVERDLEVWNSPPVLLLFLVLVSLDCFIRKRQGMA